MVNYFFICIIFRKKEKEKVKVSHKKDVIPDMDPLRLDPLCLSSFLSCKPFLSILSSPSLCFQRKSPMWYDDDAM